MFDVQKIQQHNLLDQKASAIVLVKTFKECLHTQSFLIDLMKLNFYSKDACKPGFWSTYGTPECSVCPIGSYSNNFGASKCTECPFSKSTDTEGTNDESFCQSKFSFTSIYCFYSMYQ